ncbi:glycosyltransferase family protein [Pedobacter duraquae]|nr:hypothetical protein [Pedobacter duraquae]
MRIVLITSGQPSTNPRIVKEADSLSEAGFQVTLIYAYWTAWATYHDEMLLKNKSWKAIRVGGDPLHQKWTYLFSRLFFRISRLYASFLPTKYAQARSTAFLIKEAKALKADLYIAHNLGALPAAFEAAKKHNSLFGFDAEDFHRQETNTTVLSREYLTKKQLEDKYLPKTAQLTTSSPQIAALYKTLYPQLHPVTLLNTFQRSLIPAEPRDTADLPVKLFWFSQTIGSNRGLENIIQSLGLLPKDSFELHLMGKVNPEYQASLYKQADDANIPYTKIKIHDVVAPEDIFRIAQQFDIGIASEPGFSVNNENALSNKFFTYLQCGLVMIASDTVAQKSFFEQHTTIGKLYQKDNSLHLSEVIQSYIADLEALNNTKKNNYMLGQELVNWETEHKKFITCIRQTLIEK